MIQDIIPVFNIADETMRKLENTRVTPDKSDLLLGELKEKQKAVKPPETSAKSKDKNVEIGDD